LLTKFGNGLQDLTLIYQIWQLFDRVFPRIVSILIDFAMAYQIWQWFTRFGTVHFS
jgi:hypothetical protein